MQYTLPELKEALREKSLAKSPRTKSVKPLRNFDRTFASLVTKAIDYCEDTGLFFSKGTKTEYPFSIKNGYKIIRIGGYNEKAHRVAFMCKLGTHPRGLHIHHINGDKSDNRAINLYPCTMTEHKKIHKEYKRLTISKSKKLLAIRKRLQSR